MNIYLYNKENNRIEVYAVNYFYNQLTDLKKIRVCKKICVNGINP